MTVVCEECRDWPITKRQVFVNYNNSLRIKRESKQRQARLAADYASDQSVYETDTDVPVDEPSVPVQNVHVDRLNLGQQQCLISEEIIVPAGPSTETDTSQFLSLPTGEGLDKLVLSLLARITDLESTRGLQPPVQNQPITNEISQQAVISPNVCQPSVQSQSAGSKVSQQGFILPNVCQPSVENQSVGSGISQQSFILPNVCQPSAQAGSQISQQGVILPNVCQPVFTNTEVAGVSAPPPLFLNPVQPVFKLPTAPISGDSLQRTVANEQSIQVLQETLTSTQQAIASFRVRGLRPHQSLLDSAESLAKNLKDARLSSRPGVSHLRSLRRLRWCRLVQRRLVGQRQPKGVLLDQSSSLLSLVHRNGDLKTRLIVSQTTHLARGVVPHPARGVVSLATRLKKTTRIRVANNGTTNRTKRIIFVLPCWIFC